MWPSEEWWDDFVRWIFTCKIQWIVRETSREFFSAWWLIGHGTPTVQLNGEKYVKILSIPQIVCVCVGGGGGGGGVLGLLLTHLNVPVHVAFATVSFYGRQFEITSPSFKGHCVNIGVERDVAIGSNTIFAFQEQSNDTRLRPVHPVCCHSALKHVRPICSISQHWGWD